MKEDIKWDKIDNATWIYFNIEQEILTDSCFSFVFLLIGFFVLQPEPKIQYTLKAIGGSLTAVPGLSDMIDVW